MTLEDPPRNHDDAADEPTPSSPEEPSSSASGTGGVPSANDPGSTEADVEGATSADDSDSPESEGESEGSAEATPLVAEAEPEASRAVEEEVEGTPEGEIAE